MTKIRKVPYYTMERSLFRGKVWKEYYGSVGAVPINTLQKVSYENFAAGAPPKPPKPTKEQLKAQQAEEAHQRALAEHQKKQQPPKTEQPKSKVLEAEDQEKLPEFNLQDIPSAMDKIGWPVAAKVAKKWFANLKHVYNDQPNSVQPIDDTIVTLNWALKYGNVKDKLNDLLGEKMYSPKAQKEVTRKITEHVKNTFLNTQDLKPNLSLDTTKYLSDLRQFHIDWEFQFEPVSTYDTLDGLLMTDLSGALGSFNIYVAIGIIQVTGDRYSNYDKKPNEYCIEPVAELTHVYVYLKDNYSFNDGGSANSQYLGHWNKTDMILSYTSAANDLLGKKGGDTKIEKDTINWDYLINRTEVNKPVDKRTGFVGKLLEKDVYWPVYNKSYNEWREKNNRGGDFMIYSKPRLYKLKKPLTIKLETICRPSKAI